MERISVVRVRCLVVHRTLAGVVAGGVGCRHTGKLLNLADLAENHFAWLLPTRRNDNRLLLPLALLNIILRVT